jgi:hypothetical protein
MAIAWYLVKPEEEADDEEAPLDVDVDGSVVEAATELFAEMTVTEVYVLLVEREVITAYQVLARMVLVIGTPLFVVNP